MNSSFNFDAAKPFGCIGFFICVAGIIVPEIFGLSSYVGNLIFGLGFVFLLFGIYKGSVNIQ